MTTAQHTKRVIAIGMACVDQVMLWQDLGAPVHTNRLVACDLQGGGMAATASVAVARLGGRAELWSAVGADWAADLIVRSLDAEHVDTAHVERVKGCRGPLMVVCVDQPTGERCFYHATGYCRPAHPVGDLRRLRGAGCLLVDGIRPKSDLRAAREARRLGVPVVGDVGWIGKLTPEILKYVDYAILSESCARRVLGGPGRPPAPGAPAGLARRAIGHPDLSDPASVTATLSGRAAGNRQAGLWRDACRAVRAMGPACVVITLGAKGLAYLDGDRYGRMKAFRVKVVDTTGAGDVFHGAFCYGLVEGFALEKNLRFASAAAAMKCRHIGGRAGIPTRREVMRFLKHGPHEA